MPLRSPGAAVVPSRSCRLGAAPAARAAAGEPARHGALVITDAPRGQRANPGAAGDPVATQRCLGAQHYRGGTWRARAAVRVRPSAASSASSPRDALPRRLLAGVRASSAVRIACRTRALKLVVRSFVTLQGPAHAHWPGCRPRLHNVDLFLRRRLQAVSACRSLRPRRQSRPAWRSRVSPTRDERLGQRPDQRVLLAVPGLQVGQRGVARLPISHGADTASIRGGTHRPTDRCTPATCNPAVAGQRGRVQRRCALPAGPRAGASRGRDACETTTRPVPSWVRILMCGFADGTGKQRGVRSRRTGPAWTTQQARRSKPPRMSTASVAGRSAGSGWVSAWRGAWTTAVNRAACRSAACPPTHAAIYCAFFGSLDSRPGRRTVPP